METIGYGSHLVIDGFNLALASPTAEKVETFLYAIAPLLDAGKADTPEVYPVEDLPSGVSATLLLPEAHASVHIFEEAEVLTLRAFSRHGLEPSRVSAALGEHFGARRFESHLGHYSRTVSRDAERRRITLLGERAYAGSRLLTKPI